VAVNWICDGSLGIAQFDDSIFHGRIFAILYHLVMIWSDSDTTGMEWDI